MYSVTHEIRVPKRSGSSGMRIMCDAIDGDCAEKESDVRIQLEGLSTES